MLVCPSSRDEPAEGATTAKILADLAKPGHVSYVYRAAGLRNDQPQGALLMHENPTNHKGVGGNALYGDGRVEWLLAAELQQEFQRAAQGPTTAAATAPVAGPARSRAEDGE
jgi:prepilin-type processing-associated H-X9-DG protein